MWKKWNSTGQASCKGPKATTRSQSQGPAKGIGKGHAKGTATNFASNSRCGFTVTFSNFTQGCGCTQTFWLPGLHSEHSV